MSFRQFAVGAILTILLFSLMSSARAEINLWPLLKHKEGVTDVLWPLLRYDAGNGDFAARPLIEKREGEIDIVWPLIHWSDDLKRVFPFITGKAVVPVERQSAVDDAPTTRSINYYSVFPIFYKTPDVWTLFPVLWKMPDGFAVFPLYGHRASTVDVIDAKGEAQTLESSWRFCLWPLYWRISPPGGYHLNILFGTVSIAKQHEASGWSIGPLIPLVGASRGPHQEQSLSNDEKHVRVTQGEHESFFVRPLISSYRAKGRRFVIDAERRAPVEAPGTFQVSRRSSLFVFNAERRVDTNGEGETIRDKTNWGLFPLVAGGVDQVAKRRELHYLLFLLNTERGPETRAWNVLGLLTGYKREGESRRFSVLWRLFEYSKDDEGQKRLGLFFLPRFKIGDAS